MSENEMVEQLTAAGISPRFATETGAELVKLYAQAGENIPCARWLVFHRTDCGINCGYETWQEPAPSGAVAIWTSREGYVQRGQHWVAASL